MSRCADHPDTEMVRDADGDLQCATCDELLKAIIGADVVDLRARAKRITQSEEFKRTMASLGETAWAILKPILVAGAAGSPAGPVAGLVVSAAGSILTAKLHELATKEV